MANQHRHSREWDREVKETCARLRLCAVLPERLSANVKIRTVCLHGVVSNCRVYSLIERQYCCKSAASKAHDPALKSKASRTAWYKSRDKLLQKQKERWSSDSARARHSQRMKGVNNSWIPTPAQRSLPGMLYLIRYLDDAGTHFKLGITKKRLSERFSAERLISVIQTWNLSLGECFDLEQTALHYAAEHGHRYSSPTTTELIRAEGILPVLEFIEHFLDDGGHVAEPRRDSFRAVH